MGTPTIIRIAVVTAARRTLTQMAVQSTLVVRDGKAVAPESLLRRVAKEKRPYGLRSIGADRRTHDHAALVHPRVEVFRHGPERPRVPDRWRQRQRERHDSHVRRTGLDELHGLGHVVTEHEPILHLVVD